MFRWIILIILLIPGVVSAQKVPATRAAQMACSLMGNGLSLKSGILQDSIIPVGNPDAPAAYVITFKPGGFVIVSAQVEEEPILGYSLTTTFPENPEHPLRSWLLPAYQLRASHSWLLKNGHNSHFTNDQMVQPLVSAKWGQGDPWNRYCPADLTGKKALVGCVAVAMSQIMEKWQWPLKGTGEIAYTPPQHPEYGELSAIFDTTHYHWDLTHDIYPTESSSLILYHTGIASLMNYDPSLSSTSVDRYAVPALKNFFSYQANMVFREMEGNSDDQWIRMLHQELDNSRPVLYCGTSPDGKSSHAFNIDGYRNDTYFHFNWGWNGAGDGWYTLAGMAGGGSDFSTQQGAVFGLQPATMPLHDRPSGLDVLAGDGFVQLFWEQPVMTDFSHFMIYRDGELIGQTAETHFRDSTTENERSYSYEISAYYQGQNPGESVHTPPLSILPYAQIQPEYAQTFEIGLNGWQIQNTTSGFQIGPATDFHLGGNSGTVASICSQGHPVGEQVADYLISPIIYPGKCSHPAISFDYLFKQNQHIDQLYVVWRDYQSGTWQTLATLDSTGGYSDWKTVHFYLPQNADNQPIQFAFYYNDYFGQGFGAAIDNIKVYQVTEPAIPGFSVDQTDLCLGQTVTITDQSVGTISCWEWDFGAGAEPRYATTPGPHQVSYSQSGSKTIKLSLNHLDHLVADNKLSIREKPVAAFGYTRQFMKIYFTDQSSHAEQLLWIFGDGTTAESQNPVHNYYTKEIFTVQQIAFNGSCAADTLTIQIDMRSNTGIDEADTENPLTIFPNPTSGPVTLQWDYPPADPVTIRILSASGQEFFFEKFPPQKEISLDLHHIPDGVYILQATYSHASSSRRLLKFNK